MDYVQRKNRYLCDESCFQRSTVLIFSLFYFLQVSRNTTPLTQIRIANDTAGGQDANTRTQPASALLTHCPTGSCLQMRLSTYSSRLVLALNSALLLCWTVLGRTALYDTVQHRRLGRARPRSSAPNHKHFSARILSPFADIATYITYPLGTKRNCCDVH